MTSLTFILFPIITLIKPQNSFSCVSDLVAASAVRKNHTPHTGPGQARPFRLFGYPLMDRVGTQGVSAIST
jgi:hypothetical protein